MAKLNNILILIGLAAIPVVVGLVSWNLAADSPVQEARAESTAAMAYASLTAAAPPTATPNGTPTPSVQDILFAQATAQHDIGLTQQASADALEREKMELERLRLEEQMKEQSIAATAMSGDKTAIALDNALTAAVVETKTAYAIATAGIETMAAKTEMAPFVQAQREAELAQEELDRRKKAAEVQQAEFAVDRTRMVNWLIAYGPWGIGIAMAFVASKAITEWIKTRAHPRDEAGRSQTLQKETKDGTVFVQPDQMETGIVKVTNDGEVIRYAPMDPAEQANINRGRGIADIVGQLPNWAAPSGKTLLEKFTGGRAPSAPPRIIIKPDDSLAPVIEKADDLLLEEA